MPVVELTSGISTDGVTETLVDIGEEEEILPRPTSRLRVELLASETFPFSSKAREELPYLSKLGGMHKLYDMNFLSGENFAQAASDIVAKAARGRSEIGLIGCHGQTICWSHKGGNQIDHERGLR